MTAGGREEAALGIIDGGGELGWSPQAPPAVVPYSRPESAFARYLRHACPVAHAGMIAGALGVPAAAVLAGAVAGPLGTLIGAALGLVACALTVNRVAVFGNRTLRRDLARRLRVGDAQAEFVGLCRPENNSVRAKLLTVRAETDDNIGFLCLRREVLEIITEEATVVIPRASLKDVRLVRFVEIPLLFWVRLEFFDCSYAPAAILLVSRECDSLAAGRRSTRCLYERVADWFTDFALERDSA